MIVMNMSNDDKIKVSVKHLREFIKESLAHGMDEETTLLDDNQELDEVAPEGWEGTVKSMKKHKEIDNPWALANWMKKKGYHHHK